MKIDGDDISIWILLRMREIRLKAEIVHIKSVCIHAI